MPLLTPTEESRLQRNGFIRDYLLHQAGWIGLAKVAYQQAGSNLGIGNNPIAPSPQEVAAKLAIILVNDGLFQHVYRNKPWFRSPYLRPSALSVWSALFAKYIVDTAWGVIP